MLGGRIALLLAAAALAPCATAGAAAGAPGEAVAVGLAPGTARAVLPPGAEPAVAPALVARLERRLGRPLPELRGAYLVAADDRADARRLARRLDARAGVEATVAPRPAPPPALCRAAPEGGWPPITDLDPTPDLSGFQDYREGLGIPAAASGAGVRVADVEYAWRASHEELSELGLPAPVDSPVITPDFMAEDHGTAVLGVLAGDDNGAGITGLAHEARMTPVSPFFPDDPDDYRLAEAIALAASGLRAGDVLLVEQQLQSLSTGDFVPVEAEPGARAAIRAAVALGIVVVEPAANSAIDLASIGLPSDPAHPQYSGALVVGAGGSAATGNDLGRSFVSNYGARVDVQGYGEGVLTTGYGAMLGPASDPDRRYTACFDGTSSASATVAGAVAALQGIAIAGRGAPLTPAQVRTALVATGVPQEPADSTTPIGPRPQVAAAAEFLAEVAAGPPPSDGAAAPAAPAPVPTAPAPPPASAPRSAATTLAPKRTRPATTGLAARLDRRRGRLTIALRGLAPRAAARVGGRVARIVRGTVVLRRTRPGRLVVRVSAPARDGVAVRATAYRLTIPAAGPARVARLPR